MMVTLMTAVSRAETQHLAQNGHDCDHQRQNWFPPKAKASHESSAQALPAAADMRDQAIAPLPPAATTGLASLAALGVLGARRAVKRFLFG
jgi:hypothetical protein